MSSEKKINTAMLDHFKFFIVLTLSFMLTESLMVVINLQFTSFFGVFVELLDTLAYPLLFLLIAVLIVRGVTTLLPELNLEGKLSPVIPIASVLILTHPIIIQISGSKIALNWLVIDIIEEGLLFSWIGEVLIFSAAGYFMYLIQIRSPVLDKRYARYLHFAADDILTLFFLFGITLYLIRSFISDPESITLTIPVKFILLYVFSLASRPIDQPAG